MLSRIGAVVAVAGLAATSAVRAQTNQAAVDARGSDAKGSPSAGAQAALQARLGAPASTQRVVVQDEMRALIDAGALDPRRSLLQSPSAEESQSLRRARSRSSLLAASDSQIRTIRAGGAPGFFNFGQNPPAVADDFESYVAADLSLGLPTSHAAPGCTIDCNASIVGQTAPWGGVWDSDNFTPSLASPEVFVVARADDPFLPAGAPATDGSGNPSGQMLAQLRTLSPATDTGNSDIDITDDDLWIPTSSLALVIGFDYYFSGSLESLFWADFASLAEGFVSVRYFVGGFPNQIGFGGVGVRPRDPSPDALGVHPVVLGLLNCSCGLGEFYDTALVIQPDQWVTVAQRISPGGQSMFHRTPATDGSAGVLITDRADAIPFTGFESGWAETYPGKPGTCLAGECLGPDGLPGTADDATYPQLGETPVNGTYLGVGFGLQQVNFLAPSDGEDKQAPITAATSHDFFQFHRFNDPAPGSVAGFAPSDTYIDNLFVTGTRFAQPIPIPDQALPYIDDMERWTPAPLRLQAAGVWFTALGSQAFVSNVDNATPPPGSAVPPKANAGAPTQSIRDDNIGLTANGVYREALRTNHPAALADPVGPDGLPGTGDEKPAVLSVKLKVSNTINGRSLITSGLGAHVLLGTRDPTTGANDNRVYVRQPNFNIPGTRFNFQDPARVFNPALPGSLVQDNQRSSALFSLDSRFNDDFWNYEALPQGVAPGGFVIPTGVFFETRLEISGANPQGLADADGNQLFPYRLFVNGVELCPPDPASGLGDCVNNTWVALRNGLSSLSFFSAFSNQGLGQTLTIDDVFIDGAANAPAEGPLFSQPYFEGFETYAVDPAPLSGQGTIFALDPASVPNANFRFFPDPAVVSLPALGICRYQIVQYISSAEIPDPLSPPLTVPAGATIAIAHDLAPNPDPLAGRACPGVATGSGGDILFIPEASDGPSDPRQFQVASKAQALLLTPTPIAGADPADFVGYRFDQHLIRRWATDGGATVRLDAPAGNPAVLSARSLRIVATGATSDENSFAMRDAAGSFVPTNRDSLRPGWVTDLKRVSLIMFIETQVDPDDPAGANFPAPLQRFSLQAQAPSASGDSTQPRLVSELRFGGPDLDPVTAIPADEIAVSTANPAFPAPPGLPPVPPIVFASTGEKVPMGRWFSVGFEVNDRTGAVRWLLDRTPATSVFSAGSDAAPLAAPGSGSTLTPGAVDVARLQFRIGDDEGGAGIRVPPKVMVQGARNEDPVNRPDDRSLLSNPTGSPWSAPRPVGATAGPEDWCVYEINAVESPAHTAPLVQPVDPSTGALVGSPRPIAANDLLAVYRRRPDRSFTLGVKFDDVRTLARLVTDADIVDAPGADFGSIFPLFDCPSKTVNGVTDDGFVFLDDLGNEIVRGQWTLEGQPGQPGVNDPFPNGGVKADAPPYNGGVGDPLPDGSPGTLNEGFRNIVLAQFYMIPALGADIQPQRWFIDNIFVIDDCAPVGPTELLALLADFSSFGPSGLLDLLGSFGLQHPSCP